MFLFILDYSETCPGDGKMGGCEHFCKNITGGKLNSYICGCYRGFTVNPNNTKTCKGMS